MLVLFPTLVLGAAITGDFNKNVIFGNDITLSQGDRDVYHASPSPSSPSPSNPSPSNPSPPQPISIYEACSIPTITVDPAQDFMDPFTYPPLNDNPLPEWVVHRDAQGAWQGQWPDNPVSPRHVDLSSSQCSAEFEWPPYHGYCTAFRMFVSFTCSLPYNASDPVFQLQLLFSQVLSLRHHAKAKADVFGPEYIRAMNANVRAGQLAQAIHAKYHPMMLEQQQLAAQGNEMAAALAQLYGAAMSMGSNAAQSVGGHFQAALSVALSNQVLVEDTSLPSFYLEWQSDRYLPAEYQKCLAAERLWDYMVSFPEDTYHELVGIVPNRMVRCQSKGIELLKAVHDIMQLEKTVKAATQMELQEICSESGAASPAVVKNLINSMTSISSSMSEFIIGRSVLTTNTSDPRCAASTFACGSESMNTEAYLLAGLDALYVKSIVSIMIKDHAVDVIGSYCGHEPYLISNPLGTTNNEMLVDSSEFLHYDNVMRTHYFYGPSAQFANPFPDCASSYGYMAPAENPLLRANSTDWSAAYSIYVIPPLENHCTVTKYPHDTRSEAIIPEVFRNLSAIYDPDTDNSCDFDPNGRLNKVSGINADGQLPVLMMQTLGLNASNPDHVAGFCNERAWDAFNVLDFGTAQLHDFSMSNFFNPFCTGCTP